MDYLGWELKRQLGALGALLGGGRDSETLREGGTRRDTAERAAAEGGRAVRPRRSVRTGHSPGTGRSAGHGGAGGEELAAWTAGRGAGADVSEGEESGPDVPVSAWEQVWESVSRGRRSGERTKRRSPETSGGTPEKEDGPAAEEVWNGGPPAGRAEGTERKRDAGERRGGETGGGGPGGGGPGENPGALGPARRRPVWAPEEAAGAFPEGGAAALRREDGGRALSRAVQRDARRYDGGFTIY